jgi:uncharacterized protein (DUF697 family)
MTPPKRRKKLQAESFPQVPPPAGRPEAPDATGGSLNQAFDLVEALGVQAPKTGAAPIPSVAGPSDPPPETESGQVSDAEFSVHRGDLVKPAEMLESPRSMRARVILQHSLLLASGSGLLPMPFLDGLLISTVQIRMLHKLADLYDVSFSTKRGKWLISSLGSYAVNTVSLIGITGVSKMIPGVGTLLGMASMPLVAGAYTYALGSVLIGHFERGGDLGDFDPQDHQASFQEEFRQVAYERE